MSDHDNVVNLAWLDIVRTIDRVLQRKSVGAEKRVEIAAELIRLDDFNGMDWDEAITMIEGMSHDEFFALMRKLRATLLEQIVEG